MYFNLQLIYVRIKIKEYLKTRKNGNPCIRYASAWKFEHIA